VEIAPDACVTINVLGGKPGFKWRVKGSGSSFDEAHTITEQEIKTRSLSPCADLDACGTAAIEVTDGWGTRGQTLLDTLV